MAIATYTATTAKPTGFVDFMLNLVPTSIVDALAKNDILQILVFATLFGIALSHIGPRAKPVWLRRAMNSRSARVTGAFLVRRIARSISSDRCANMCRSSDNSLHTENGAVADSCPDSAGNNPTKEPR